MAVDAGGYRGNRIRTDLYASALSVATPELETIKLPLAQNPGQYVALHCVAPKAGARQSGPAEAVLFMVTRPQGITIRDVVIVPTSLDL